MRGGTYEIFLNLVMVLASIDKNGGNRDKETSKENANVGQVVEHEKDGDCSDPMKVVDPVALAKMLDGYGSDGHTLAHWCAKRGEFPLAEAIVFANIEKYDRVGAYLSFAVNHFILTLWICVLLDHCHRMSF